VKSVSQASHAVVVNMTALFGKTNGDAENFTNHKVLL
jgi:hypothetical protein